MSVVTDNIATTPPSSRDTIFPLTTTERVINSQVASAMATTSWVLLATSSGTEDRGTSENEVPGISTDGKETATLSSVLPSVPTLLIYMNTVVAFLALAIVIMTVTILVVKKLARSHKSPKKLLNLTKFRSGSPSVYEVHKYHDIKLGDHSMDNKDVETKEDVFN